MAKPFHCTRCGSRNHATFDCTVQNPVYTPPPDLPDPEPAPTPKSAVKTPERAKTGPILEPARWPGGPLICSKENLPSFPDESAMKSFQGAHLSSPDKQWKCEHCKGWHYSTHARGPGMEARSGPLPPGFIPFRRRIRPSAFEEMGIQAELPKREAPAKPQKPKPATKPAPGKKPGDLFLL